MMLQVLGSEGQSSRSQWSNMLKMHFLALLTWYLENYLAEFHKTFSVDAFWSKDKRFKSRVKRSKAMVMAGFKTSGQNFT